MNDKRAVHVTSNDPVTVYALNYLQYSSDATIVLPVQSIGKEYAIQVKADYLHLIFLSLLLIIIQKSRLLLLILHPQVKRQTSHSI